MNIGTTLWEKFKDEIMLNIEIQQQILCNDTKNFTFVKKQERL